MSEKNIIHIKGARENNLKNIDIKIPRDQFVVITGLSGSGKSSLAFDTIYAEGQRRYVESLSSYARQFIGIMEKPDLDYIEGLSPAISIDQKTTSKTPRSTVGTVTEIYDYLRLLYARVGTQHCVKCNVIIQRYTIDDIIQHISKLPNNTKFTILAPITHKKQNISENLIQNFLKEGFIRARINGEIENLPKFEFNKRKKYKIELVIDRLIKKDNIYDRLTQSIELSYKIGNGLLLINIDSEDYFFNDHLYCAKDQISYDVLQPRNFSFNSPIGACTACEGLGTSISLDLDLVITNYNKSIKQGCIEPLGPQPRDNWYGDILTQLSQKIN